MKYEMETLTGTAEELLEHIEEMRKHAKIIMTFCTENCHDCPLKGPCDWDQNIDYMDKELTIEKLADFIDYAEAYDKAVEEKEQREEWWSHASNFAGIDPEWLEVHYG